MEEQKLLFKTRTPIDELGENEPGKKLDPDLASIRRAIWSLWARGVEIRDLPDYIRDYVDWVME